jgi:hypothetical protein
MNRDHNKVSAQLASPDATPASTWNRGNVFRHLAKAGWDPNGLSELQHLEEALQFLEEEVHRVRVRDVFLENEKADTVFNEAVSATQKYNSEKSNFADQPGVMFDSVGRVRVEESHLPQCFKCGTELQQNPDNGYKPDCPNRNCVMYPTLSKQYLSTSDKSPLETKLQETPTQMMTDLIVDRPKPAAYTPLPVNGAQTAFQNYMSKPAESATVPVVPGQDREIERVVREASFVETDRVNQRAADLEAMERDA